MSDQTTVSRRSELPSLIQLEINRIIATMDEIALGSGPTNPLIQTLQSLVDVLRQDVTDLENAKVHAEDVVPAPINIGVTTSKITALETATGNIVADTTALESALTALRSANSAMGVVGLDPTLMTVFYDAQVVVSDEIKSLGEQGSDVTTLEAEHTLLMDAYHTEVAKLVPSHDHPVDPHTHNEEDIVPSTLDVAHMTGDLTTLVSDATGLPAGPLQVSAVEKTTNLSSLINELPTTFEAVDTLIADLESTSYAASLTTLASVKSSIETLRQSQPTAVNINNSLVAARSVILSVTDHLDQLEGASVTNATAITGLANDLLSLSNTLSAIDLADTGEEITVTYDTPNETLQAALDKIKAAFANAGGGDSSLLVNYGGNDITLQAALDDLSNTTSTLTGTWT